ncbi:MAG: MMPL family transporter [Clostridia bacterium]
MNTKTNSKLFKLSNLIVAKRNLLFFTFVIFIIFSLVSMNWVNVENSLTSYLDEESETLIGLNLMEDEFYTYATATVMISNVDFDTALSISEEIKNIEAVQSLAFENTQDYYINSTAKFSITFNGEVDDEVSVSAMEEIRDITDIYDSSISTEVGYSTSERLAEEMQLILVIAVLIIIAVLLFTSKSYAEILVLLITFGVAAILNKGTNFVFGEISFVSNSVVVILQLALAIDYAIILCHRFAEERVHYQTEKACTVALSKAIPEISSSSLTTMCGLFALSFMEFGLGMDLAKVLIKSILISLLCVFTLMPGLLVVFGNLIDKTQHKSFVPSITKFAEKSLKTRYVVLPIFLIVAVIAGFMSSQTNYLFSESEIRAKNVDENTAQKDRITSVFGSTNDLAIVFESGDYQKEAQLIAELESFEEVGMVVGLANTEAIDNYTLTELLTAREFSELFDIDYEIATLLYYTYALEDEDYAKIVNTSQVYELPMIDVILFLDEMIEDGYITLDTELEEELTSQSDSIRDGQMQLESENYSRILVTLNLNQESEETFAFLDTIKEVSSKYYQDVYLVGNSTSNYDLSQTFSKDNLLISVLSALFVIIVLLFTFGSVAIPIFLIIIIQSAIFINFAFPYLMGESLFFIGYLVVAAIQMGANVDYGIVITNRYMTLRKTMDNKKAIIRAIDESFATIATSGIILASAGFILEAITTEATISTLGACVGRGTVISMILVLLVLPQLLYVGTKIIDKTSFSIKDKL